MSITTRSPRKFDLGCDGSGPGVGPGSYNLPGSIKVLKETPFPFNTTASRDKSITNDVPGPADYHPEIPRLNIPTAAGMKSSSARSAFPSSDTPAPTEHAPISQWSPRINPNRKQPMSSRSPRISFTGDKQFSTSPADLDTRPKMTKGVTISNSARYSPRSDKTPGPGAYNITKGIEMRNKGHKSAVFLNESERDIFKSPDWISNDCGIGHSRWKVPDKSSAPFGSKAKKKNFWGSNKNPGPGSYSIERSMNVRGSSKACFGGSSERNLFTVNDVPGPGEYKVEKRKKIKADKEHPFLSKAERFPTQKREYDAEACSYNIDYGDKLVRYKKISKESPAFMSSIDRNPYKVSSNVPGAGAYSPEKVVDKHKLKTCIDGSERNKPGTMFGVPIPDNPSPCQYVVKEPTSRKGVAIRHSKRGNIGGPTDVPAPGSYDTSTSMVRQSYNVTYSIAKL